MGREWIKFHSPPTFCPIPSDRCRNHNFLDSCFTDTYLMRAAVLYWCSKPVSRVLSFKTAIYLDAPLLTRSSRLPGTAGPACMSLHGVAPDRVYSDTLLPECRVSSYLAFPPLLRAQTRKPAVRQRYLSVALFLGLPPAGVTRYPCPVEPGLSSSMGLSPHRRGCPACLQINCIV